VSLLSTDLIAVLIDLVQYTHVRTRYGYSKDTYIRTEHDTCLVPCRVIMQRGAL
jgi:hypothetical protein